MSYAQAKQRYAEKSTFPEEQASGHNCHANGCPMGGGISTGGHWVCSYHHQAAPEDWPRVTEALRDSHDIRLAINEIMKIDMISWGVSIKGYPPRWQEFEMLFDQKPALQPNANDKLRKTKYEYRLRNELAIVAGLARRKHEKA
jgi:hypothetical protein